MVLLLAQKDWRQSWPRWLVLLARRDGGGVVGVLQSPLAVMVTVVMVQSREQSPR